MSGFWGPSGFRAPREVPLRNEADFPTVRFLTCKSCGQGYTASLSGVNACPRCQAPAGVGDVQGSRVTRTEAGGHVLLTISGPLYRMQELDELRRHVDAALDAGAGSLAFHFDGASRLDSSMLGQIARAVQALSRQGRPAYLVTWDPQVVESLRVVDLDRVITVLPTVEAWREALPGGAG